MLTLLPNNVSVFLRIHISLVTVGHSWIISYCVWGKGLALACRVGPLQASLGLRYNHPDPSQTPSPPSHGGHLCRDITDSLSFILNCGFGLQSLKDQSKYHTSLKYLSVAFDLQ